jgi:lysophospholipase L1-like esterase
LETIRVSLKRIFLVATVAFAFDAVWVLFFHGFKAKVGAWVISSATIEFPVLAFLVSFIAFLLVQRKSKEAGLMVASIALACLVGEGVLRIGEHPWAKPVLKTWIEPADVLGWRLPPNFEGRGIFSEYIRTNAEGLRDVEHSYKKEQGTLRILGIGDSFTFGWGVQLEETFMKQLEKQLDGVAGRKVETIVAGVPGYGLNQYYIYLKYYGVKYHPDIVVIAYFTDDLPTSLVESLPPFETFKDGLMYKGGVWHHSRLYNFITTAAGIIRVRNRPTTIDYLSDLEARRGEWSSYERLLTCDEDETEHKKMCDEDETEDKRIRLLEEYLTRIQAITSEIDATFMLMFIPDIAHLYHPEYQSINRVLARLARAHNVPFVDMTPIFEASSDPRTNYLWPRDAHTNRNGHFQIANALKHLICLNASKINCHEPQARTAKE